jgi:large subunit GTPase 1
VFLPVLELCHLTQSWLTHHAQVVDARDPLTYYSQDLVDYALELHPTKTSFVLLNKADLLPEAVRAAWADYFDAQGVKFGFWSAFVASEAQAKAKHDAAMLGLEGPAAEEVHSHFYQLLGQQAPGNGGSSSSSSRTKIMTVDELLEVLEDAARAAVAASDREDPRRCDTCMLVCYSSCVITL